MLVLSRKLGEVIFIGDSIKITVVDIERGKIRLGIEAPRDVRIDRQEIHDKIEAAGEVKPEVTPPLGGLPPLPKVVVRPPQGLPPKRPPAPRS